MFIRCLQLVSFRHVHIQWNWIQNKISPNISTLVNVVLVPKLLNNPFAFLFLINFDFLLPHMAHFDNIIALLLLLLEIFGSIFLVFFVFFYTLNNMIPFYTL